MHIKQYKEDSVLMGFDGQINELRGGKNKIIYTNTHAIYSTCSHNTRAHALGGLGSQCCTLKCQLV